MSRLRRSGHIEIDLLRRQLSHFQGSLLVGTYPIAIGKPATPSPLGEWSIINKKTLNYESVFGTRWMGLNNPGYGIHGNNNPSSIGQAVSNGCIRMYNQDVEQLFSMVHIGTQVIIHNGKNHSSNNVSYDNDYTVKPENNQNIPLYQPTGRTYQIQSGDTLWSISQKLAIPLNELIKANPDTNPNNLMIGQIIKLP